MIFGLVDMCRQILLKHINMKNCRHNSCDSLPTRRRLATEPGLGQPSTIAMSPNRSPVISPDLADNCFDEPYLPIPPRSPRAQGMSHVIHHDSLPTRRRLATEPGLGQSSTIAMSPNRSPVISPDPADNCFDEPYLPLPPRSPRSPRSPRAQGMSHVIHHRFVKTIKVTTVICQLCEKPMFIGYKCRECKYRCHRDCVDKVPPSCGLPTELVDVFKQCIKNEGRHSPVITSPAITSPASIKRETPTRKKARGYNNKALINIPSFPAPDSSPTTSSCNSSTPSSPALVITPAATISTPPAGSKALSFQFPEVNNSTSNGAKSSSETETEGITLETRPINCEVNEAQKSNDSDKTVSGTSGSTSTDSEKTLAGRIDSQDSQISDMDQSDLNDQNRNWPNRQNSLTMREWDIPFDELIIEDALGTGRFGTVFKGNWHGSVAIKRLNMNNALDDRKAIEAFKQEVAMFRKTRHDNLVLFMGACMSPPHLAIVTSLCKGMTLYTHIHIRRDKFNLNRTIIIAQQIAQGMGYLNARGIIHKDLKTKNIFYENGKVVITDFGLLSVTRLCHGDMYGRNDCLTIPKGWLCYLAPELIRNLRAGDQRNYDDLPFSAASDVFAFGTVWYELLLGDWPFKGQPSEVVIWQVGKGIKQSLSNVQASKEIKELLMICWSYKASDRPEYPKLLDILIRLPKKKLQRSPSHPIHLLRSAESIF